MGRRFTSLLKLTALGPLFLTACAAPTSYFGIDLARPALDAEQNTQRAIAVRERDLLMFIAALQGCYTRQDGGFGPVRAVDAERFECLEILADVEARSAALGLGRAPGGIWALDLTDLARRAQEGDKNAQLELGIRFEEGIGLTQSRKNACKLYAAAATKTGGTIYVYVPPVGNGTSGRVMPVDTGPVRPGLKEARERRETAGC